MLRTKIAVKQRDLGWFVIVSEDDKITAEVGPFDTQQAADEKASAMAKELGLF